MKEVFASPFQEEILVLRSLLDSAGIEAQVLDGSQGELSPFWTADSGGYRLLVGDEDGEDALAIVEEHRRLRREGGEAR